MNETNLVFLTDTEYPGHGHSSRQTSAPETSDESGCDTQPQSICRQGQKQTPIGPSAIDNIKVERKDDFEKEKLRTSNGHVNGNGRIPPQTTESNSMPEAPSMTDKYSYQDSIDDEDCTSSLNTSKPKLRASTARRLGNLSDFSKKIGLHNPKLPQWNLQDCLAAYSVPHSQDHITNGFNLEYISSDYVLDLADFWDPFPDIDECELET
ncbi:Protein of unknown function [Pyronema omphalodes CBS 100304]|uniref:Uncharacterized protein n=1 Tax=Pyronema omphalodes (strain CBS 100304) TaxID=1076935 RepID=U4KYL7_PYROM|nr:Protein of unknown function [Pyronema omphalodes CBS 100304]